MKLFLDDERFPPECELTSWTIVRSVEAAKAAALSGEVLTFVSFDHDLGDDVPTGMDFARWLCETDLDQDSGFLPRDFDFYVHSQNPVGRENIEGLLRQYLSFR